MQSDNEKPVGADDVATDTIDSSKETTLNWLMDLDRDEPEENLFVVERRQPSELALSAYETEVAARPMVRGRAGADDLDFYVAEEIVMSEPGGSDIYSADAESTTEEEAFEGLMAIDFTRGQVEEPDGLAGSVSDGSDILGLEDEDEIGDSYFVVKRVKKADAPAQSAAADAANGPVPDRSFEAVAADAPAEAAGVVAELGQSGDCVDANPAPLAGEPERREDFAAELLEAVEDPGFDEEYAGADGLEVSDEDFADLDLGESMADTGADVGLDLHEDFTSMAGFGEDLMAVITPRLAALMDEVNKAVETRLCALGRAPGSVIVDVSVATDAETASLAGKQGYEAVAAVCADVPEALEGLTAAQLASVMLRLTDVADGKGCNQLFLEELAAAAPDQAPVLAVVEHNVFDGDILEDDLDTALPTGDWAPDSDEIDALFDDLESGGLDVGAEAAPLQNREPADTVSPPAAALMAAQQAVRPEAAAAEEQLSVFGENIFEADPVAADDALPEASAADIDRLFDELGPGAESGGEICGVDLADFAQPDGGEVAALEVAALETAAVPGQPAPIEDMSWCIPEDISFSYSSPGGGDIFAEFLDAFIEEGASELEKLEDAVAAWEANIGDEAGYTQVARILHTIKGIAKGVGLHFYGTLIHNFETLLERLPRPEAGEQAEYFRVVNAWLDAAVRGMDFVQAERRDIVSEFPHRGGPPAADEAAPQAAVEALAEAAQAAAGQSEGAAAASPQASAPQQRKAEDKKLADEGARALAAQQSVRITSAKLDLLLNMANQAQQLGVRTAQSTNRTKRASAELQGRLSSVRAHIADIADRALFNVSARGDKDSPELDALEMDQYTELQEAANILREGVEDLADLVELASRHNAQAEALLKQQATVISSIGSSIRAARVVPVSRLMPGLRRLVRTVSNDLGKEVAFRVVNEVGTLDRDDYARCQTILEHMVRNALDHGIESAEERRAAGKASVGQITVDVRMEGADSVIVLSDDGRGIDPDAMRESAIRKGLDVDAYALSDEEAQQLIFHKGFSTAASVSQISGRGVGMDIVLSELQQMGGDIRIESRPGSGTAFHIRIPSNVTVNGALLVTAGEISYAIPLGGLIAVDEVPVDDFFQAVEQGHSLEVGGTACEPAYLGTLCQSGNLPDRSAWRNSVPVIIAGSEARHMAIAIDDVEEALELVIRSLGVQFAAVPGIAGAATTADGEAIVALDLNVLVSCFPDDIGTAIAVDQVEEDKFLALVVDDSRTQRMVATSQLESVGIETATAENGAVAIDWLNTTEYLPDVILLDVEMPVKDGIQTLREIRKSARYSHIPVIMVTSRTGIKHRSMAEQAGCNGYMGKPFNFRMLIGQINQLTGQRLELS